MPSGAATLHSDRADAGSGSLRAHGWRVLLGCYAALTALFYLSGGVVQRAAFQAAGTGAVIAILAGVRIHRPRHRAPWYAFAAGVMLSTLGDITFDVYEQALHRPAPTPSLADGFSLASYVLLTAGVLLLAGRHQRGGEQASAIDGLMVSVGVGVVSWVTVIDGYAHQRGIPVPEWLTLISYPLLDLLLMVVLVRLLFSRPARNTSYWFVAASLVSLLVADGFYCTAVLNDTYASGSWIDLGWFAEYALWGAAALHPSMRSAAHIPLRADATVPRWRMAVLWLAAAAAPVAQVIQTLRGHEDETLFFTGATVVMVALIMLRMRHTTAVTAEAYRAVDRCARRERMLSEASVALVAATTAQDVYDAVAQGAWTIAGSRPGVPVYVGLRNSAPGIDLVATAGITTPVAGDRLPDDVTEDIEGHVATFAADDEPVAVLIVTAACDDETAAALDMLAGEAKLALASVRAIEERQRERGARLFGALVGNSSDVITVIGPDMAVRYQSPAIETVLGTPAAELTTAALAARLHLDDVAEARAALEKVLAGGVGAHAELSCRMRHQDGGWRVIEAMVANLIDDPDVGGVVVNGRDVTHRHALEAQLAEQALHDRLTELPNRLLLTNRVEHALRRRREPGAAAAVLFVDLDDFKIVNDSKGHPTGDLLLRHVAARLQNCARPDDTVARLGGDEFAILIEDAASPDVACTMAERVLAALGSGFTVAGEHLRVGASIGIAYSGGATTADELLRDADLAMYVAKRQGKSGYQLFDPSMHEAAVRRLQLSAELREAIRRDELVLHYQPIVDVATGRVDGAEVLVRWQHPERGLVMPGEFIPIAEETGLVVELGRHVLRRACHELQQWRRAGHVETDFYVTVNVSARHLVLDSLVTDVSTTLTEAGLPATALVVEITETTLMQDVDSSAARLSELKRLGVRVAVDDFGTGFSSLSYLSRLDVDILKIDKSFVDRVTEGEEGAALVRTVVDLGRALGLDTVAEGIEDRRQLDLLDQLGCHHGQGFYLARPMPGAALVELLAGSATLVR